MIQTDPCNVRVLALFGSRVLFGQERANIETLAALKRSGCDVLCVVRSENWQGLIDLRRRLQERGLNWVCASHIDYPVRGWILRVALRNPFAFLWGNFQLRRIIKSYKPTHIHAFNQFLFVSFLPSVLSSKAKLIYRSGDKPVLHNAFYRLTWRLIRRRAAWFGADSLFIRGTLIAAGVDQNKIRVIYAPAPSHDIGTTDFPPVLFREGITKFVYVGQVTELKGVDLLITAFSSIIEDFPHTCLIVCGPITQWSGHAWARELREKVKKSGLLGRAIFFTGYIEDIPALMKLCHVHVAPSMMGEAYGLVAVEAKSSGIPSIVFRDGGLPELVENGVNGIVVERGSVAGLAEAMRLYASNQFLAAQHGEAARLSLESLRISEFQERWLFLYQSV